MGFAQVPQLFPLQRLDLDHFRALVAEHHGGHRARHHAGEIQYFYSIQWSHNISRVGCFRSFYLLVFLVY